jgi:molecular chaperone Hsp33
VRGQWVRLRDVIQAATAVRSYPPAIESLLAQMLAAVSMFADNLKFSGAVALQSKGEGALLRSLAECREQQFLRGIAHLDAAAEFPAATESLPAWLRKGQLALSLIPEDDSEQTTYQGLIELSRDDLGANLEQYFVQSEQLPTRLFFDYDSATRSVTGLLLQRLPAKDLATEIMLAEADEAWHTLNLLADTVTAQELRVLSAPELLLRLFNEYPCRLHSPRSLSYRCSCSKTKADRTLRTLGSDDLDSLLEEVGVIEVDCEFCGSQYTYDAIDVAQLFTPQQSLPPTDATPDKPTLH